MKKLCKSLHWKFERRSINQKNVGLGWRFSRDILQKKIEKLCHFSGIPTLRLVYFYSFANVPKSPINVVGWISSISHSIKNDYYTVWSRYANFTQFLKAIWVNSVYKVDMRIHLQNTKHSANSIYEFNMKAIWSRYVNTFTAWSRYLKSIHFYYTSYICIIYYLSTLRSIIKMKTTNDYFLPFFHIQVRNMKWNEKKERNKIHVKSKWSLY